MNQIFDCLTCNKYHSLATPGQGFCTHNDMMDKGEKRIIPDASIIPEWCPETIYLKVKDFLEDLMDEFSAESITLFLKENAITLDKFRSIGECISPCQYCGKNDFSVWENTDFEVSYDEINKRFTFVENQDFRQLEFRLYVCNHCGKWCSDIE